MGPALSLGWNYKELSRVDLGQYEQQKYQFQSIISQKRQQQQQQQQLQPLQLRPLSRRARQRLLVSYGVKDDQIRLVEDEIKCISKQRLESRTITPQKERRELLREKTRFLVNVSNTG